MASFLSTRHEGYGQTRECAASLPQLPVPPPTHPRLPQQKLESTLAGVKVKVHKLFAEQQDQHKADRLALSEVVERHKAAAEDTALQRIELEKELIALTVSGGGRRSG